MHYSVTYSAMSSNTMSLSFENVKVFKMFATLVVGMATIFCRQKEIIDCYPHCISTAV